MQTEIKFLVAFFVVFTHSVNIIEHLQHVGTSTSTTNKMMNKIDSTYVFMKITDY